MFLTPSVQVVTGAVTIPAGNARIVVQNTGAANGLVGGAAVPPGKEVDFSFPGRRVGSLDLDGTGTSLLVTLLA